VIENWGRALAAHMGPREKDYQFAVERAHPDAKFPHAVERFLALPLPDTTRRKFLWDNCARLYGLDR
jgi:predicted TIM-barrel fold metal-dependent hydrolase